MASVLDLGLIDQFSSIFAILFIFLIVFAVLESTNVLKAGHGVHGLIALIVALISATNTDALSVVTQISPFFVIVLVVIFFLFLATSFAGFKFDEVLSVIGGRDNASIWIILVTVIIVLFGLGNVYGQSFLKQTTIGQLTTEDGAVIGNQTSTDTNTGSFADNLANTIYHPKVLGMILVMLIGAFAIALLTRGGVS